MINEAKLSTNRQNIKLEGTYQHHCLEDFARDRDAEICKDVRPTQYSKNHVQKYKSSPIYDTVARYGDVVPRQT